MTDITNCSASQDSSGFLQGTAIHTYTDGMTISGLDKPPKSVFVWKSGGSYGAFEYASDYDGTNYNFTYAADWGSNGSGVMPCTATYSPADGTLTIKASLSRWNGSLWDYAITF